MTAVNKPCGPRSELEIVLSEYIHYNMRWKRQDMNPVFAVLDEIALEGLDGITFDALELRLQRRWNPITNTNGSPLFKRDPEDLSQTSSDKVIYFILNNTH